MVKDGLWDAFNDFHMGNTAENVAEKWQLTREEQDAFAAHSQAKAEEAQNAGKFTDEIVPVTITTRKGETVVDTDEHPKHGTTLESLAKLRPARHSGRENRLRHQSTLRFGLALRGPRLTSHQARRQFDRRRRRPETSP